MIIVSYYKSKDLFLISNRNLFYLIKMLSLVAKRIGFGLRLGHAFSQKKAVNQKQPKEKKYGILQSDEKMIKLTTKEDNKEAEKLKVRL